MSRRWNWWEEGRADLEHDRLFILGEWDNGAPQLTQEQMDASVQAQMDELDQQLEEGRVRRADLVARDYNEDLEKVRLQLLRTESDAAFFGHVLAAPANPAQRDAAERRLLDSRSAADALRSGLGDPEQIIDGYGDLPAQRRERNIRTHMENWRHPKLRDWATNDRRRFTALLKMPMPEPESMCSECEAPAEWHGYDLSLPCSTRHPQLAPRPKPSHG